MTSRREVIPVRNPIRRSRHEALSSSEYHSQVRLQRDLSRARAWSDARVRHPHLFR
jgi:hypothetical protein